MSDNSLDNLKDAFASPLGDFIASIGEGVGQAQAALDEGSLRQTLELYNSDPENSDQVMKLLREVGYQPTFYTIPKTIAKAKVSLSISQQKTRTINAQGRLSRTKMYVTPINASNVNKYNLDLKASAEIEFEIVPVPPNDSQIIRLLPNFIIDNEGRQRPFKEIKILLTQYGLNYKFSLGIDETIINDESTFDFQDPPFSHNELRTVRAGDVITLGIRPLK